MFVLRLFAVERMVRAAIVAAAAYAVWRFQYSRSPIEQAFDRELPLLRPFFRQLGYDLDQSKLVELIRHAFTINPATLRWIRRRPGRIRGGRGRGGGRSLAGQTLG